MSSSRNINKNATILELANEKDSIAIAALYGPSDKDDHEFFINIKEELNNSNCKHTIAIGDFNTSANFSMDT